MPQIQQTLYGYLVVIGRWRFSFVKKENTDAFELGPYAGPKAPEFSRRTHMESARSAMLNAGHTLVV